MKTFIFTSVDEHINQGHFQLWREFCKESFGKDQADFLSYASFNEMLTHISSDPTRFTDQHVHLEWVHDLNLNQISKLDMLANELNFNWSTHMSTSQALRNNPGSNRLETIRLFKHLQSMSRLTNLWTWDSEFHGKKYGKFRIQKVPDIQNTELVDMRCDLCLETGPDGVPVKMIGLVGQLYGYRGVDLVASLARKNTSLNFLLIGRGHPNTYSRKTKRFLKSRTRNLVVLDKYLETEVELNHAINHLSCLVIDTSRYPEPSGISTRALAFGIPILIKNNDSYLKFLSKSIGGIHFLQERLGGSPFADWEKVNTPNNPIVVSKESSYFDLLEAKRVTLETRL